MVEVLFWRIPVLLWNNCEHLCQFRSLANLKELFFSPLSPQVFHSFSFGDIISDQAIGQQKQLGERIHKAEHPESNDTFSVTKHVTWSYCSVSFKHQMSDICLGQTAEEKQWFEVQGKGLKAVRLSFCAWLCCFHHLHNKKHGLSAIPDW